MFDLGRSGVTSQRKWPLHRDWKDELEYSRQRGRATVFRQRDGQYQSPGMLQSASCSVTSPFLAHAQPPSNQSSENALGIKSTVGCVVSDKSLALSELQLPSQPGGFIILTFRTIQEVQFDQSSNIQQAPPECLAPYQACRSPGLAWKSRACPGSSAQGWT